MNELALKIEEAVTRQIKSIEDFILLEDESLDALEVLGVIHTTPDLVAFWKELYRVLKPKGKATIIAPFAKSNRAWMDPLTRRSVVEETFALLHKPLREQSKQDFGLGDLNFEFVISYEGVDGGWANRNEEARNFALKHYWNIANDLKAILIKA